MNGYFIQGMLMNGYEFLTSAVPFLIVFLILRGRKQKEVKNGLVYAGTAAAFLIYLCGVFHFTGAGTIWEPIRYGNPGGALLQGEVNLVPFSQGIDPVGYGLNVVLFLPFGFLLPLLWRETDTFWRTAGGAAMLSVLVELSQLVNNRSTDVDDLIMNTLGGVLGYSVFKVLYRMTGGRLRVRGNAQIGPFLFAAVVFLGRFFFFDEMGIAGILYGF
ncbi:VanZ family protein [Mediterraneibacter glycyrrhizinilyticus]|nr:VanZ family protein [Mediterraneibacter glycyrrhizinilyticus]MBM6855778.1 VanZ family protein [Mediterraneibacter glycyrrhizinilyticus]